MALDKLKQYATEHGQDIPEQELKAAGGHSDEINRRRIKENNIAHAERLKITIAEQLRQGNAPQAILFTAVNCIGLLSDDPEWAEDTQQIIESIYGDLQQQSLFIDNAAIEAQRLQELHWKYKDKLEKQITKQLANTKKLSTALSDLLEGLENQN